MEIREYAEYREGEIYRLYSSVEWKAYTDDMETLRKGIENSLLTLGAYEGDELVGLVRAVGDGSTIIYVQDLLVLPEHQHKGIGSALLREVMERFSSVRHTVLITDDDPAVTGFYRSLGFSELSEDGIKGMIRIRQKDK